MSHIDPANAIDHAKITAHFEKVAQTYESDGGGVQATLCRNLLTLASEYKHPIVASSIVLDNAAGPGILTGEVIKQCSELPELHAADYSPAMIKVLNAKGWGEKHGVQAAVMDAQDLKYPHRMFTHVFMNMGIFMLADPIKGIKEIYRTLKPGGVTLVTTIRSAGWVVPFQRAQKRVRPEAEEFQGMLAPEWAEERKIRGLLVQGGFDAQRIEVAEAAAEMSLGAMKLGHGEDGPAKLARDVIVRGWSAEQVARFDETLREEFGVEIARGETREIRVWVGIATK